MNKTENLHHCVDRTKIKMKYNPVIKWTGSKRTLSEEIITYFPKNINTYYEPFCGGCSILYQLLHSDVIVNEYICSDINIDLITFFNMLKENPNRIYDEYKNRWHILISYKTIPEKQEYYNKVRNDFNITHNPFDFIFLSRTAYNGLIRYNRHGNFNSPFHLTRNGINPEKFKPILIEWSRVLNEKSVTFITRNYNEIKLNENDYMFLDPPYCNSKELYYGNFNTNDFLIWLSHVSCNYSLTFDGIRGINDNSYNIPVNLYSQHVYLNGYNSGFSKLLKNNINLVNVKESLYIK